MSASILVAYATRYSEAHLPPQSGTRTQEHASQRLRDWTAIRAWASNLAALFQPAQTEARELA